MSAPTKKIVAIGGGEIRTQGTLAIDKEIVRLSGKKHPKLLFIPTASSDDEKYWHHIDAYFGKKLGCRTNVLYLLREHPSHAQIKKTILGADIIYVGGGNTLKMMTLWRRLGVDVLLKQAWKQGIVLCGMSAGSICWFDYGHSDSMSFYHPKNWNYIRVRGLGLIPGTHCPHYNSQTLGIPRKQHFKAMMQKVGGTGIAIDDNCAIEFIDDTYRVITSKKYAKAYTVYKKNGKIFSLQIAQKSTFTPVDALFSH